MKATVSFFSILIFSLIGVSTLAQSDSSTLKLEGAIALALTNNHGIIIANYQDMHQQKNVHIGNVGWLPSVDLVGQKSLTQSVTDMEFASPSFPPIVDQEAGSTADLAQVQVSYLLFNGGVRMRSYNKLKKGGELSEMQKRISIESTMMQVINAYFEVVRLNEAVKINTENLSISQDRLSRIKAKNEFGGSSKIELLSAEVDYNTDESELLTSELKLNKAKHQLNFLLGKNIDGAFDVAWDKTLPDLGDLESHQSKTKANNANVLLAEINLNISELDQKINRSNLLPTVSSSFSYGYQGSTSDVGVVKESSSLGFTGMISLTWNLFDGFKKKRALEQAKIKIQTDQVSQQQAELKVSLELHDYYESLKTYLKIIQLEESNLNLATLNLERSSELFANGSINNTQFRQAQMNLLVLKSKINNYHYMANIMGYQLSRLKGELYAVSSN